MLPLPSPKGAFPLVRGAKSVPDLITDIGDLPCLPQQACRCFRGKIDEVLSWNLHNEAICVPLDIRGYKVTKIKPCSQSWRDQSLFRPSTLVGLVRNGLYSSAAHKGKNWR